MATAHGKDGAVEVGGTAVAEVVDFQITETANTAEDTVMGDDWETHLVGTKTWNGSLTCRYDNDDATGQGALTVGESVSLALYPEGNSGGNEEKTGTATITEVTRTVQRDSVVEKSFNFLGSGALTTNSVT